jgi:hypothetical protein
MKLEEIHNSCIRHWSNETKCAKEIYKLHLESQLTLIHTLKNTYYNEDNEECLDDIIHSICNELETKLKELE